MFIRQNPINPTSRRKFDSYLGYNRSWWSYYVQYKNIIDEIVANVEKDTPIDTVSLPLLFLIRHGLELSLKANILKLEEVNPDIERIKLSGSKYHSLSLLYDKFVEHLRKIKKDFHISKETAAKIDDYLQKFFPMVEKLHKLDQGSYSFRYPVDTNGNYIFSWNARENISEILDLYYSVQPFLVFTENVLNEEGIFP